jgi:uncharacterized protein YndB with AHSA1/START domain
MTDVDVVEVGIYIAAPPEAVFPYFTDPDRYIQWMGEDATLVPEPGGTYRVRMREGVEAAGEFVEVDPPRRVVFTWGWTTGSPVRPGTTRVVVTFVAEGHGTRVVLRHHGLPADQFDHHETGWALYLDRLDAATTGRDPGPDPVS